MNWRWGLVGAWFLSFFSKEKTDDEMMQGLKFKALARGTIVAFFITHLFNTYFLIGTISVIMTEFYPFLPINFLRLH